MGVGALDKERLERFRCLKGIATQEQRKRKQRDAQRRGLPALRVPKHEVKQAGGKAMEEQQQRKDSFPQAVKGCSYGSIASDTDHFLKSFKTDVHALNTYILTNLQ
ncbi:hypothetical protein PKOR_01145 [Pontibacter korlensis]|uniref:Uncharacterized protein n=1 Tax=Pontibacter korlensis TaxID=400092 RepID=A0A0E3UVP0_9BACT|nr:hypothetical protein [Pontibacter korlensis]AKD02001.1 hypothetical protein PKOR_01145 [Pontibacter korlensis]